jgi:hypothetical protein
MEIEVYFKRVEGKLYRTRVNPRGDLERTQLEFGRILDGNSSGDCYGFVHSNTNPNLTKELQHTPTSNSKCMP